ncbi:uncharacterized protein PV07_08557 [Cladophialophora immunda]|uniref:PNPLA domain-containing protein n=1 Tax=Cladophialophora immunda TaxID=569365 RepID=A0A0D2CP85_9EURO|nr:uncharacterized protein PV07_08557 [Cladophialophora immunda]KIW25374.1 hypothetical protein PV07_08557 [Cladophialophora immunda]
MAPAEHPLLCGHVLCTPASEASGHKEGEFSGRSIVDRCPQHHDDEDELPIQLFFDLIIGTSSGGIIALGLGANGWNVHMCMRTFEKLCKQAFTKRKGIGIPWVEHFVTVTNDSRYETAPIEKALKSAFGEDQDLFAGSREEPPELSMLERRALVAVVTTTLQKRQELRAITIIVQKSRTTK